MPNEAVPILEELTYLFSHSGNKIVAHCLELDLITNGNDITDAEDSLNAIVSYQVSSCWTAQNLSQLRFKAPQEYWDALEHSRALESTNLQLEVPPTVFKVARATAVIPVRRAERGQATA